MGFLVIAISIMTQVGATDKTKNSYIKYVEFNVTSKALQDAIHLDIQSHQENIDIDCVTLLAYLCAKYGGDFSKYKYEYLHPQKIYQLDNSCYDYRKLRKFFISILWRASISRLEEWSNINLGGYEKKALEILKDVKEHEKLFKILIYKNCYTEDINQEVLIAKGKTSKYKKYVIQMAGYRIEVMVDSSRITNQYKERYEKYFLNQEYLHIIETPEVSWRINKEYKSRMSKMYEQGFVPPKPPGVE